MDTLLSFLPYVAVAVIAYNLGNHMAALRIMRNLVKNPENMIELITQLKQINESELEGMPDNAVEVESLDQNGVVYAYEKATGKFLSQAEDLRSAMVEAAKRNPGKQFWHPELKQDSHIA